MASASTDMSMEVDKSNTDKEKDKPVEIDRVEQLFDACDLNGSGYIEKEDLQEMCSDLDLSTLEFDEVFHELDQDMDGKIDFREFVRGFQNVTKLFTKRRRSSAEAMTSPWLKFLEDAGAVYYSLSFIR